MERNFKFEIFSLSSARRLLGEIRDKVLKIAIIKRRLTALKLKRDILSRLTEFSVSPEELKNISSEMRRLSKELDELTQEIEERGVVIRDPIDGLIEFPTIFKGRPAYFVWRLHEPTITHWRPAEVQDKIFPIEEDDLE